MGSSLLRLCSAGLLVLCLAGGMGSAQPNVQTSDEVGVVGTVVADTEVLPPSAKVIRLRGTAEEKTAPPVFSQPGAPKAAEEALALAHQVIALLPQQMFPIPPAYAQGHRVMVAFPEKGTALPADSLPLAYVVVLYSALSQAPALGGVAVVGGLKPDGALLGVKDFALLAEAAANAKLQTLIAPWDNLEDWNALPQEVRLRLRVVLVRNLASALWHALGPYGPYAQAYNAIAEAYRLGVNQALSEDYDSAERAFATLAGQMPDDTSLGIWLQFVRDRKRLRELQSRIAGAREALEAGNLDSARTALDEALTLDPGSQEALSLKEQVLLCMNDFSAPEVWVSLEEGSQVSGTVPITVKGKDDYRLVKLALYVDGQPLAEWGTSPGEVSLDASALLPGQHLLLVEGRDVAGNVTRKDVLFTVAQ